MIARNFSYDGHYLSDFEFIICSFDGSRNETISTGSKITFNTVAMNKGRSYHLTSTQYDECYTATFSICKDPSIYGKNLEISNDEYRDLMRWLNRKEFLPFYFIEEDGERCFYNASFTVEKVLFNDKIIGFTLELITDKPFGYGQIQRYKWNVTDTTKTYRLTDVSDELGYIYPDITITINQEGDFALVNETTGTTTIIKNCKLNEKIKINGATRIISTDNEVHAKTLQRDFNYQFCKIQNSIENRINNLKISLPCKLEISYTPIIM